MALVHTRDAPGGTAREPCDGHIVSSSPPAPDRGEGVAIALGRLRLENRCGAPWHTPSVAMTHAIRGPTGRTRCSPALRARVSTSLVLHRKTAFCINGRSHGVPALAGWRGVAAGEARGTTRV